MKEKKVDVSVIIPVFNEEENLNTTYSELRSALDKTKKSYEFIFVDDGSTDKSLEILKSLNKKDKRVRIVSFSRNFGQNAATSAGFELANGEVFITIDCDLQNDPEDIQKILEKFDQGYEVVSGIRTNRKDPLFRKFLSLIFNKLLARLTGIKLKDYGCNLKAYSRFVGKNIIKYGDINRYIPTTATLITKNFGEVNVWHRQRRFGKSKYNMFKFGEIFLNIITNFSARHFQIISFFSIMIMGLSATAAFVLLILKALSIFDFSNTAFLILLFIFILFLQIIVISFIGEYQIRTYKEVQGKPLYIIKERI